MTLAELTLLGIPAVLIPSPNVTHDHQHYNAGVLEQEGAAVVIDEEALTGELLRRRLTELIESPQTLASMAEKSRKQGHPAAAQRIVELVREMATA
jgi:UDP-N-acetylglucosamine--N-acetylmuramyl-(pentapeptide) pyrophosphoryl-undecaprenol N-acetylglucosamine transferase